MERLTEFEGIDDDGHLKYDVNVSVLLANEEDGKDKLRKLLDKKVQKCIRKLGAIEDLEEEIGMPLIELFGYIGKEIYVIGGCFLDKAYYFSYVSHITVDFVSKNGLVCKDCEDIFCYGIDTYKKIWFLSEEEALEALEEMKND